MRGPTAPLAKKNNMGKKRINPASVNERAHSRGMPTVGEETDWTLYNCKRTLTIRSAMALNWNAPARKERSQRGVIMTARARIPTSAVVKGTLLIMLAVKNW